MNAGTERLPWLVEPSIERAPRRAGSWKRPAALAGLFLFAMLAVALAASWPSAPGSEPPGSYLTRSLPEPVQLKPPRAAPPAMVGRTVEATSAEGPTRRRSLQLEPVPVVPQPRVQAGKPATSSPATPLPVEIEPTRQSFGRAVFPADEAPREAPLPPTSPRS